MTSIDGTVRAMFPLGSVLFPGGLLPLHIFEPRYQQLLNHTLEGDRLFGVVLITRGFEVGGGDVRSDVGTLALIEDYQRFDDGRAAVRCRGTKRFEVREWLEDDPFPQARIVESDPEPQTAACWAMLATAIASFDALIDVAVQMGRVPTAPRLSWDDDLDAATWQLAARCPVSAHDHQAVLAAPTRAARLTKLDELLRDVCADLKLLG